MYHKNLVAHRFPSIWDNLDSLFTAERDLPRYWQGNEIKEEQDAYVLRMAIPGIKRDQLEISLDDKLLTVGILAPKAEEGKEQGEQGQQGTEEHLGARYYGKHQFRIGAAIDADGIVAKLEDGILSIHLAKLKQEETKRLISVQ